MGLLAGCFAALALVGVPGGHPVQAIVTFGLAWGLSLGLAIALVTATTSLVLGRLRGRDGMLWNANQSTEFATPWPRERAMAAAIEALEFATGGRGAWADPRAWHAQSAPVIDPGRSGVGRALCARVEGREGGGSRVVFSCETRKRWGGFDLGESRTAVDRAASAFEQAHARGFSGEVLGLDALPPGALEMLASLGATVGMPRPVEPGEAVLRVPLRSSRGATRDAVIVPVAEDLSDEVARYAAVAAGAREAQRARGGAGFALLEVGEGEDAARVGRAMHQALLARREGYRGRLRVAASGDEKEQIPGGDPVLPSHRRRA